jgi:hypothetical protein
MARVAQEVLRAAKSQEAEAIFSPGNTVPGCAHELKGF